MVIDEIFSKESGKDIVDALKKGRLHEIPRVEEAEKLLNPLKHDVHDKTKRPDKTIKVGSDDRVEGEPEVRVEKVARVALALQKLIIKRAASFLFGNDVKYTPDDTGEQVDAVMRAFNKILRNAKSTSLNRKIARSIFGYKECAELWYPVESPATHNKYGFPTKTKVKCAVWSPKDGNTLYPYFDSEGDLVAFSREYSQEIEGKTVSFFETYTNDSHYLFSNAEGGYALVEGYPKDSPLEGKIPIVYGHQDYFETENVDGLISRLEKLLSNFADTNDYHASPKIVVKGNIVGWAKKGESGSVIEMDQEGSAEYLSWNNAPESVKLEIETLLKFIYTISQTPDISFDSVKGLGAISGIALKLLFMDAHLKVQDKRETFDEYLQRRSSIIKSYIGQMNSSLAATCENIDIDPEIEPYMLTSEIDEINMWLAANGNKPLVSHKTSVVGAGLANDPDADFEEIKETLDVERYHMIGEPVMDV